MFNSGMANAADQHKLTAVLIDKGEQLNSVVQALTNAGFRIIEALGINEAVSYVRNFGPWLVIVGEDHAPVYGADLLPLLRGLTVAPIVVVGSGGQHSLVRALEEGADAYVDRSVTPAVFLARVRAMLRRYAQSTAASNGVA